MGGMSGDLFAKVRGYDSYAFRRELEMRDLLPYFRTLQGPPAAVPMMDGAPRVNLGSSNYLGLSGDPRLTEAANLAAQRYGTSVNGSRLMNGTTELHLRVEAAVADWFGEEDALVFGSGYTTNLGVIGALVGEGDVAVCDAGDHASILDGAALARGRLLPFRHNRMDRVEALLRRAAQADGGILVVVDTVYSMQGDLSDIVGVTGLSRRYGARLLVDEAHAVGVLGPDGQGVAALACLADAVDLRMGTFSKALGGGGGFVTGPADVIDFLRVQSRAFMFTAAAPPGAIGAALAGMEIARAAEGEERRVRLAANTARLRAALAELGFGVGPVPVSANEVEVQTPILRVPAPDDLTAARMWRLLYDQGVYVNVALHPAVPKGQAQLRVSVMATHTEEHLERVVDAFTVVARKLAPELPADLATSRA
ncbi:pyridoxal phosphate-dependent aminotransferase family protein [Micromonospora olivasterospora]|uniref:8-amino-7-oxononanoate synthase n=2 Tax=Micromonospora olivasterospora TaxID=1880 RepID=A0A562IG29_MICOL|nr:8-amino-7-oxononanoate synthase [Micromonospora olivasterospora]